MANQTQPASRKRLVHQLDTPFSTVSWPEISHEDQDTILELLCDLLSPLGQHRRTYIKPSRGKRAAKRNKETNKVDEQAKFPPVPPLPPISASVDIGLDSITRHLQSQLENGDKAKDSADRRYSMIVVARGDQSSAFNCHFPQMVAVASQNLRPESKIRLIGISKPCSERLSTCLGVPRVSSIAILNDTPGAGALQDLVRKVVPSIDAAWLELTQESQYLPTKINAIETTVGSKKVKKV